MNLEVADIVELLNRKYKTIGEVLSVKPLQFSFHVNNQLFLVEAGGKRYISKFNEALNDFYGIENAISKLEVIGKSTQVLKQNGLNVEETIPDDNGNFVNELNGGSIRLFHFIEGKEYSSEDKTDLIKIINFSKKLHSFPITKLESEIPNIKLHLSAPYSLEETVKEYDFISSKLESEIGTHWNSIKENFGRVHNEAKQLILWSKDKTNYVTHVDLHPRNVIVGSSDVSVIDLDYLRIGNPYVCLGLTFTRTGFFGKPERIGSDLKANISLFESTYCDSHNPDFIKDLLFGALYIEAEKIFRNLYRFYKTGKYRNFAEDVAKFHYQIFEIVGSIIRKKGY